MYSGNHLHMLDFDDVVLGWFWWYCSSEFASLVHPLVKPIQCIFSFHSITMELLKNHTRPRKDLNSPKCVMDEGVGNKKQQGLHYLWIVYLRKQLLHSSSDIEKWWIKAVSDQCVCPSTVSIVFGGGWKRRGGRVSWNWAPPRHHQVNLSLCLEVC